MRAELKALLTKVGLEEAQITALAAEEGDVNTDDLFTGIRDGFAERLKNDDAFLTPIKSAVRGEVLSSKERKMMKEFGVTQEEYDALPEKVKFDALIALCGTKSKPSGTPDDVKEEIKKLREQLVTKDERIKKLVEEEIPEIKSTVDRERQEVQKSLAMQKALKASLNGRKLLVSEDAAFTVANSEVSQKYDFHLVEGELKVRVKGTDREAFNDDTNKPLTVEQLFSTTLDKHSLIAKSNAGDPPPTPPQREPNRPTNIVEPAGLAKARAAAEAKAAQK